MPNPSPQQLLSFIEEAFKLEDLQTLCFKLEVKFDNLSGTTLQAKARELIEYMQMRDRIAELIWEVYDQRQIKYLKWFGNPPLKPINTVEPKPQELPGDTGVKRPPIWGWLVVILLILATILAWKSGAFVWLSNDSRQNNETPAATQTIAAIESRTLEPKATSTLRAQPQQTATSTRILVTIPSDTRTITPTSTPSSIPTSIATQVPQAGDIRVVLRGEIEVEQVYVPAGQFIMGSKDVDDREAMDDEKPQRTVYLDAFWIDRMETTNRQYAACRMSDACPSLTMFSSASRPSYYYEVNLAFEDYPVVYIDWNAASAYCEWAGARLPTEAEWEKAARGTDGRLYPWGNGPADCSRANVDLCVGDTRAVGSYLSGASVYGVLDMAGNVWEWVQDNYQINYYSVAPANNPDGPESGTNKVLRGGAWSHTKDKSRSAYRLNDLPQNDYYNYGVRCASD